MENNISSIYQSTQVWSRDKKKLDYFKQHFIAVGQMYVVWRQLGTYRYT